MSAVPSPSKANHAQGRRDASAVSPEMVSITKAQHIDLVMLTKYWRSQHARAVQREQWRHERFGRIVHQLKEQASNTVLHTEMPTLPRAIKFTGAGAVTMPGRQPHWHTHL